MWDAKFAFVGVVESWTAFNSSLNSMFVLVFILVTSYVIYRTFDGNAS